VAASVAHSQSEYEISDEGIRQMSIERKLTVITWMVWVNIVLLIVLLSLVRR
jgi:hypothetical protein